MYGFGLLMASLVMHPFHISYAEAQWTADGTRLQVALRVSPQDLDNALSNVSGRRVLLEKESQEKKRELVEAYLRDVIFLADQKSAARTLDKAVLEKRRARFHWVGIEDELRYVWVYFELDAPVGAESVWLSNRVFFETERTQINTLQLMKTDPAVALRTTREEPVKKIPVITVPVSASGAGR